MSDPRKYSRPGKTTRRDEDSGSSDEDDRSNATGNGRSRESDREQTSRHQTTRTNRTATAQRNETRRRGQESDDDDDEDVTYRTQGQVGRRVGGVGNNATGPQPPIATIGSQPAQRIRSDSGNTTRQPRPGSGNTDNTPLGASALTQIIRSFLDIETQDYRRMAALISRYSPKLDRSHADYFQTEARKILLRAEEEKDADEVTHLRTQAMRFAQMSRLVTTIRDDRLGSLREIITDGANEDFRDAIRSDFARLWHEARDELQAIRGGRRPSAVNPPRTTPRQSEPERVVRQPTGDRDRTARQDDPRRSRDDRATDNARDTRDARDPYRQGNGRTSQDSIRNAEPTSTKAGRRTPDQPPPPSRHNSGPRNQVAQPTYVNDNVRRPQYEPDLSDLTDASMSGAEDDYQDDRGYEGSSRQYSGNPRPNYNDDDRYGKRDSPPRNNGSNGRLNRAAPAERDDRTSRTVDDRGRVARTVDDGEGRTTRAADTRDARHTRVAEDRDLYRGDDRHLRNQRDPLDDYDDRRDNTYDNRHVDPPEARRRTNRTDRGPRDTQQYDEEYDQDAQNYEHTREGNNGRGSEPRQSNLPIRTVDPIRQRTMARTNAVADEPVETVRVIRSTANGGSNTTSRRTTKRS